MNSVLSRYLDQRIHFEKEKRPAKSILPVITISRAFGCPAREICSLLTDILNSRNQHPIEQNWKWVGKEVLESSAEILNVNKKMIEKVGEKSNNGFLEDILMTLSNENYPGELTIKNTIGKSILNYAFEGHTVILGRGAAALLHDRQNALHIRLEAPLEWRKNKVANWLDISLDDATELIHKTEKERKELHHYFATGKKDALQFDVVLNCQRMTSKQIANALAELVQIKMEI